VEAAVWSDVAVECHLNLEANLGTLLLYHQSQTFAVAVEFRRIHTLDFRHAGLIAAALLHGIGSQFNEDSYATGTPVQD
jgi:hypothetical protein